MSDDVVITIGNTRVRQFNGLTFATAMDTVGTGFSFNVPFFPETREYRDLFRPFSYQPVTIKIGDDLVMTGVLERVTPTSTASSTSVNIQGRSKTGVLVDCTFEKADFPVQFSQAKLDEITSSVTSKYRINTKFQDGPGALFEEVGPQSPTETVFSFLQNLAKQRQLLISQTPSGDLLFQKANTSGKPVAMLTEGDKQVTVSTATYDGTKRFWSYDGFGQESGKNDNHGRTVDPGVGVVRPKSIQANDTNAANIQGATDWAATSALASSVSIPLQVVGWRRPDGKLWQPNDIILLTAPSIMIYRPFPMLIKSINFQDTPTARVVTFALTMPEAYSGKLPTRYSWDD